MFPTPKSSSVTSACIVVMMMMMMILEVEAMPKHPEKSQKKLSDGAAIETVPLQLDPSALVPPRTIRPLEIASISPWTYNVSHDDSLFPPLLSEARCLLQGCLNSDGVEDLSLESRPIFHQVMVLRRVRPAAGHGYHYKLESRLIAVACTCVQPVIIQHQQ